MDATQVLTFFHYAQPSMYMFLFILIRVKIMSKVYKGTKITDTNRLKQCK